MFKFIKILFNQIISICIIIHFQRFSILLISKYCQKIYFNYQYLYFHNINQTLMFLFCHYFLQINLIIQVNLNGQLSTSL